MGLSLPQCGDRLAHEFVAALILFIPVMPEPGMLVLLGLALVLGRVCRLRRCSGA